jgi:hypothetical protein
MTGADASGWFLYIIGTLNGTEKKATQRAVTQDVAGWIGGRNADAADENNSREF